MNSSNPAVGDFSFVRDLEDRESLKDAYETAVRLGVMHILAEETFESFCWSSHATVTRIKGELAYTGHSGASFGNTMRNVEAIAKGGWGKWALGRMKYQQLGLCPQTPAPRGGQK
jgi:hypothetical protein